MFIVSMNRPSKFNTVQLVKQLLKDPERKPISRMIAELLYVTAIYKTIPVHYFSRFLFKKDCTNIRDYFPSKVLYDIKPHFNEKNVVEVLENKLYFDFFYRQFDIPLPEILMFNHRNTFVMDKKSYTVNTPGEFRTLLQDVFRKYTDSDSVFIKKTYGSYGGNKIYKIYSHQLETDHNLINDIFNEVVRSGYLFQKTIRQHPDMNTLNPSCVNTLRLDTFIDRDGKIEVICGYLRTSFNNSHIDNATAGGASIGINLDTGKLTGRAYLSLKDGGMNMSTEHPVTHVALDGFVIPYFEQAKRLVIQVAGYVPNLRLIGWDVAIGEHGPLLIEGNSDYDVAGTDVISHGARSNPVFRKVLAEVNL